MVAALLHRFERDGKRYVLDPETCFCFECDAISWDVLDHYPQTPVNKIFSALESRHPRAELEEVVGELEWLRGTKSILMPPRLEQQHKAFEVERGLKRLLLQLPVLAATTSRKGWFGKATTTGLGGTASALFRSALQVLLARSESQRDVELVLVFEECLPPEAELLPLLAEAFQGARLARKNLTLSLRLYAPPAVASMEALKRHAVALQLELTDPEAAAAALRSFLELSESLSKAAKLFSGVESGVRGRCLIAPVDGNFSDAVDALRTGGFQVIEIDLEAASGTEIQSGLQACAEDYARRLLKGEYYRLEPLASLFLRIYTGTTLKRIDLAGTQSLAVTPDGAVFPSLAAMQQRADALGNLQTGALNEAAIVAFEDLGSVTTPACMTCWGRNLCGGGYAAVHAARSGSWRSPDATWCEAQRGWLENAIAAFNLLSAKGVNFSRVYNSLGQVSRPSLFSLARAAFRMNIGIRPIAEDDAELLTRWENFNDAAYFTFTDAGLLMATRYDREMDSLHPRTLEQEFMLLRKTGEPMGLMRLRPATLPGSAMLWLYLHAGERAYGDDTVRRSFKFLLEEACKQQALASILVPVGPFDVGLEGFLESVGFSPCGTQRSSLYLRGMEHDVGIWILNLG